MNNPVISIHPAKCFRHDCPNEDVCYMKKRRSTTWENPYKYLGWKTRRCDIYVSVCECGSHCDMAEEYFRENKKVNITLPVMMIDRFKHLLKDERRNRLQISVHSLEDIKIVGNDIQKLYLIKDKETLSFALDVLRNGHISNIHFPIDMNFITKEHLLLLVKEWVKCKDASITIDSCVENYVVHGKCLYETNYIDLSCTGEYRKCPFAVQGLLIPRKTSIMRLIRQRVPTNCKYRIIFGGKDG